MFAFFIISRLKTFFFVLKASILEIKKVLAGSRVIGVRRKMMIRLMNISAHYRLGFQALVDMRDYSYQNFRDTELHQSHSVEMWFI